MNARDDGGVESGNYLNLSADDLDRNVYRIVSFERLREMFETNVNVLVDRKRQGRVACPWFIPGS